MAWLGFCLLACVSCRTAPLPPADFSQPGWQVHEGQAVWKPTKNRPELAGDLLLATNATGDYFIQFTKTPFSMAVARRQADLWQIEFGTGEHAWSGKGTPPRRFSWFQLPTALDGTDPTPPWKFTAKPDHCWRLENPRTGESLEGCFP
jgi:hypothetical protein